LLASCKDRLFDNPLDPNGEKRAYEIMATIQTPGIVPLDLTFSEDSLWVVDTRYRVLSLNYNSGAVLRELEVEESPSGIAYDIDGLWLSLVGKPQLIKVHILHGNVLRLLNLARGNFGPVEVMGSSIYVYDRESNMIKLVDSNTGTIQKTISRPGFSLNGVAFDGTHLWVVDAQQQQIYRLNPDGDVLFTYQAPAKTVSGICFSQGLAWLGDQTGKIYQLRFQ